MSSFDRFVEEQERDPEFKALLDAERRRLWDGFDPPDGVREPKRPVSPTLGGAAAVGSEC